MRLAVSLVVDLIWMIEKRDFEREALNGIYR